MSSRSPSALTAVGGSALAVIGLGAVRMKIVAVTVGASGVGTLGVGLAAAGTLATLLGFGLATSGVSAIARSKSQPLQRDLLLVALGTAGRTLATIGGLIAGLFWLVAGPENGERATLSIGLAIAVGSAIGVSRWSAALNGTQQFRRIAAAQLTSAVLVTGAVALVAARNPELTVFMALALPPLSLLGAMRLASGAQLRPLGKNSLRSQWSVLRPLIGTGMAASSGTLLMSASQVAASAWIFHKYGGQANGYFQACWMLTSLYPVFILATMTADYYPRISTMTKGSRELHYAIDTQMRLSLRSVIPLAVSMAAFAPLILSIVFSREFQSSTGLLRWFLVGEAFKSGSWPLSFLLLAQNARRSYILSEAIWSIAFLLVLVWLTIYSPEGAGVAYSVANCLFFVQLAIRTKHRPSAFVISGMLVGTVALVVNSMPFGQTDLQISIPGATLALGLIAWIGYSTFKERRAAAT
ncbi:oligosaccharide flippase family protein [Terrabacter sp. RAF57]